MIAILSPDDASDTPSRPFSRDVRRRVGERCRPRKRWENGVGYVTQLAVARRARARGHGRALPLALLNAFRDYAVSGCGVRSSAAMPSALRWSVTST